MPQKKEKLPFEIHASVIYQLGQDLITDVVQSLVELVKNSYDADADYANIIIDTEGHYPDSRYKDEKGYILIEDNGIGMTKEDLRDGWLTISNSSKKNSKAKGLLTPVKKRTSLGDKGLGRLSSQRLGDNLEIFTKNMECLKITEEVMKTLYDKFDNGKLKRLKIDEKFLLKELIDWGFNDEELELIVHHAVITNKSNGHYVGFSWKEFEDYKKLSEVFAYYESSEIIEEQNGTKIVITGLKNKSDWEGDSIRKLTQKLSEIISPFKEIREFDVFAEVNGVKLELEYITDNIRNSAQIAYEFDFNEKYFFVKGKAKLSYFMPKKTEEKTLFFSHIDSDKGDYFLKTLSHYKQADRFNLNHSQEMGWFIEFSYNKEFKYIDTLNKEMQTPGPFEGKVYYFVLDDVGFEEQSIFDKKSLYKDFIKKITGIRPYRDGFAINVDWDWLNLGKTFTKGRSWYGLRPENVIGYVNLSAKDNIKLRETTDREGFVEDIYYNNFYSIMQEFVKFSGDVQSFLRRTCNDFLKDCGKDKKDIEKSHKELIREIYTPIAEVEKNIKSIKQNTDILKEAKKDIQVAKKEADLFIPDKIQKLEEIENIIEKTENNLLEITKFFPNITKLKETKEILENSIDKLKEQLDDAYETMGLGLLAEALTHEVDIITDYLANQVRKIQDYIYRENIEDNKIIYFIEEIKSNISALRKELSFLSPSLRFIREQKEKIQVIDFFKEVKEYYTDKFKNKNIVIEIKEIKSNNFILYMNKGKLRQIFSNLFLNSEYWLREDIKIGDISQGYITIEIDNPNIRFEDNGRGIEPSVETSLFEPFVTTKGKGKGRGLGLYVVTQLLDGENCSIRLLPKRNKINNRRYIFEINFTGGLYDAD